MKATKIHQFILNSNSEMALLLVFLLSFLTIESALGWGQLEQAALDDYVQNIYMPAGHIPGLVIGIVENNTVVVAKGYGVQNIEFNIPADGNTLMGIGSNSKGMTGVIVAKTLHEIFPELGAAVLDTPIRTLLPNGNFTFSDRYRSETMSFRDLLSHRSCLDAELDSDLAYSTVQTIEEKKYRTRYQKESCQFRNGHNYNNALIALAGELVADIKGVPFTQLLVEFMREIGMEESSYFDREGEFENNPHMSSGYIRKNNETRLYNPKLLRRIHAAVGGGGVMSSAADMAAYMKLHLNKGKVGDRQVIPEEVMGWIYQIANPFGVNVTGRIPGVSDSVYAYNGYSLGFQHMLYDGYVQISHGGLWPPFDSSLRMFPDLKHGIFMVSNGPGPIGLVEGVETGLTSEDLSNLIFSLLEGTAALPPPKQPATPFGRDFSVDLRVLPTVHSPKDYPNLVKRKVFQARDLIGQYGHPLNGDLIIRFDPDVGNGALEMNLGEFGIGTLQEMIFFPGVFSIKWKTDIMQFYYTLGIPDEYLYLDLSYENTAILSLYGGTYLKGQDLSTLPVIPWLPDSCGPSI